MRGWLAAAAVLAAGGPAAAQVTGVFGKVVETASGTTMFNSVGFFPGINNTGVVIFTATGNDSRDRIFTGAPGGAPVVVADNPGPGLLYAGASARYVINDAGAFPFYVRTGTTSSPQVNLRIPPSNTVPVATQPPFSLASAQSPNINSAGRVSFTAGGGVYVATYDGLMVNHTTIASTATHPGLTGFAGGADINAAGTVVFTAQDVNAAGTPTILFSGNGGPLATIADTLGEFSGFGSAAINDAGTVLYGAGYDAGSRTAIFRHENGTSTPVVEASPAGVFASVGLSPSLNGHGQIAFTAQLAAGDVLGIFTGPNPATDTVIKVGDGLDGSTVRDLRMSHNALNDFGQIAFYAELADGRKGVYRFTPVPEPALGLAAAGLVLAAVARRKKR